MAAAARAVIGDTTKKYFPPHQTVKSSMETKNWRAQSFRLRTLFRGNSSAGAEPQDGRSRVVTLYRDLSRSDAEQSEKVIGHRLSQRPCHCFRSATIELRHLLLERETVAKPTV